MTREQIREAIIEMDCLNRKETDELAMDFERMTSQNDYDAIKKARELLGLSELSRISSLPSFQS